MAMIRYAPCAFLTARKLANVLQIAASSEGHPATEVQLVINYGCSHINAVAIMLNYPNSVAKAIDKLLALRTMRDGGILVPDWWELSSIQHVRFPCLGRKIHHTQGKDIVPIFTRVEAQLAIERSLCDFFSEYIDWSGEYRYHVLGEQVLAFKKILPTTASPKLLYKRNAGQGWIFAQKEVRPSIANVAKQAVRLLGLDFGAVDIILGVNGSIYVLEVNTAPGLLNKNNTPGRIFPYYVQYFAEQINNRR